MDARNNEVELAHNDGGVGGNGVQAEADVVEAGQGENLVDVASKNNENGDDFYKQQLARDKQVLENLLPEDIWLLLLKYPFVREDHKLLEALSNASLYFRQKPSQNTSSTSTGESSNTGNGHANQQLVTSPITEILRLRTVYKSWNKWVETMHQNLSLFSKMNSTEMLGFDNAVSVEANDRFANAITLCQRTREVHFSEHDQEKITKFIKHFEETHTTSEASKNPFLGRNVTFNYSETGFLPFLTIGGSTHLTGIRGILSKFGEHISVCSLTARDTYSCRQNYYPVLAGLLDFMQKLKFLKICYTRFTTQYIHVPRLGFVPRQVNIPPSGNDLIEFENINNLTLHISQERRRHLKGFSAKSLPTCIFNLYLRAYNTISRLEIENINDHDIDVIEMPNLTQLVIQISELTDWEKVKVAGRKWRLETLHISFGNKVWSLVGWFGTISVLRRNWANTLTNLIIKLPIEDHNSHNQQLEMPLHPLSRLECLHLQYLGLVLNDTFNLDFLLWMEANLKKIDITIRCHYVMWRNRRDELLIGQGDEIRFLDFFELGLTNDAYLMRERFLWNVCPSLESFDFWLEEHNYNQPWNDELGDCLATYHYGAEKMNNNWDDNLLTAVETGGEY